MTYTIPGLKLPADQTIAVQLYKDGSRAAVITHSNSKQQFYYYALQPDASFKRVAAGPTPYFKEETILYDV